jgi:secreted Zn-dependent insulinase-like peptidase
MSGSSSPSVELPEPTKSVSDWRCFKAHKLPNGLTLLLVHDENATSSSAAVSIPVGAGCDPSDRPGLAHFCEHMVFLGSSKYPGEVRIGKSSTKQHLQNRASEEEERYDIIRAH